MGSATTGSSHGVLKAVAGSSAVRLGVVRGAAVRGAEGGMWWRYELCERGALTRTAGQPKDPRLPGGKQRWIAECGRNELAWVEEARGEAGAFVELPFASDLEA
eukprot:g2589.t1